METTKYFVFPAGKPEEKFEVLPHTFGDVNGDEKSDVSFAKAELSGTPEWENPTELFTWTNADREGAFVNNDVEQLDVTGVYDIVKEVVSDESEA